MKQRKGWRMSCDIGKATEGLENELWRRWNELCCISLYLWALLILKLFSHFTYVTSHSPTLPSLYLRHSWYSNPSVASPTSQIILQPFFRFSNIKGFSLTSPREPQKLLKKVLLQWIPAHFGIIGRETADLLANFLSERIASSRVMVIINSHQSYVS